MVLHCHIYGKYMAVLFPLCLLDAWGAEAFIKERKNILLWEEWIYRLSGYHAYYFICSMGLHSAGFYRHYLKKEILLFTFGKRNCEMLDDDAKTTTSHNSFLFLTGSSVADFLSRCIIIAVCSLRKSPSPSWYLVESKSHYRFICLQYWSVQCSTKFEFTFITRCHTMGSVVHIENFWYDTQDKSYYS